MRPESRFESDVRKHRDRFDVSRKDLVPKVDYFYTPYLEHTDKKPSNVSPDKKYGGPFSS